MFASSILFFRCEYRFFLVQLPELFANRRGGQWQVLPVCLYGLLPFATEDELQVFFQLRVHRLTGFAIEVVVDIADQRVRPVLDVVKSELDVRPSLFGGNGNRLRLWSHIEDSGISYAVTVFAQIGHELLASDNQAGAIGLGFIRVLDEALVPLEASVEHLLSEFVGEMVLRRVTIHMNRLVLPLARQTELSPPADVLLRAAGDCFVPFHPFPSARALSSEDSVELLHGEFRDRVVLVDKHAESEGPA